MRCPLWSVTCCIRAALGKLAVVAVRVAPLTGFIWSPIELEHHQFAMRLTRHLQRSSNSSHSNQSATHHTHCCARSSVLLPLMCCLPLLLHAHALPRAACYEFWQRQVTLAAPSECEGEQRNSRLKTMRIRVCVTTAAWIEGNMPRAMEGLCMRQSVSRVWAPCEHSMRAM